MTHLLRKIVHCPLIRLLMRIGIHPGNTYTAIGEGNGDGEGKRNVVFRDKISYYHQKGIR